jgi:hypothetical protein
MLALSASSGVSTALLAELSPVQFITDAKRSVNVLGNGVEEQ